MSRHPERLQEATASMRPPQSRARACSKPEEPLLAYPWSSLGYYLAAPTTGQR